MGLSIGKFFNSHLKSEINKLINFILFELLLSKHKDSEANLFQLILINYRNLPYLGPPPLHPKKKISFKGGYQIQLTFSEIFSENSLGSKIRF